MSQVETRMLGGATTLSWVVDIGVALVLLVGFWVQLVVAAPDTTTMITGVILAAVVGLSVMARWMFPILAPIAAFVATGMGWVLQLSADPMIAAAWCIYPLALRRGTHTRVDGLIIAGALVICSPVLAVTSGGENLGQRFVIAVGAISTAWLLGHVEARRLQLTRESVEQQAEVARMKVQAEMAREVHDVVGHALSVISAEADVARAIPGAGEVELRRSLADIEERSRAALEQVQALVRDLRTGENGHAAVNTLPELISAAESSGLDVESHIDAAELVPPTDIVVTRVVQEALSNVIRHSGARRCEISVWSEDQNLVVRIDDDGSGMRNPHTPGSGLAGMRERVEGVGGSLTVANRLEGGTRVLARLPLEVAL